MFQPLQTTIIPRWYQLEAIDAVYNYFTRKSGNPLIGLPGGTGKSIIPAIFILSACISNFANCSFFESGAKDITLSASGNSSS